MNTFSVNKKHLKRLLIMLISSIVIALYGVILLIYDANHYCNGIVKFSGWMLIVAGVLYLFSTIKLYNNTVFEVIINDEYICINKPGRNAMNSKIINCSDIISVSCVEKNVMFTSITQMSIKSKMGTTIIDTIDNVNECAKLIRKQIEQADNTVDIKDEINIQK